VEATDHDLGTSHTFIGVRREAMDHTRQFLLNTQATTSTYYDSAEDRLKN
jgi:hypothetical protein